MVLKVLLVMDYSFKKASQYVSKGANTKAVFEPIDFFTLTFNSFSGIISVILTDTQSFPYGSNIQGYALK